MSYGIQRMFNTDFRIIHKVKCDTRKESASAALERFLGFDGLAYLSSMISSGPIIERLSGKNQTQHVADSPQFADFLRRVQIPYYEEARQYFGEEDLLEELRDSNESAPYRQESLLAIVKKYGDKLVS